MRKSLRIASWIGGGLVVLIVLAAAGVYGVSEYQLRRTYSPQGPADVSFANGDPAHGEALSKTLGCTGCHGENLQGHAFVDDPMLATVYTSNLTRALGRYSDAQLAAALREGIRHDGRGFVIMPSSMFQFLSDQDLADLGSYLRTVKPAGVDHPDRSLGPIGRVGIVAGMYSLEPVAIEKARNLQPLRVKGHEHGRYLAQTSCTECHGYNLAGPEMWEDGKPPPDLAIAASYSPEDFVHFMRTGEALGGRELPLMSEVAQGRFSHFTDEELADLHAYLVARAEMKQGS